MNTVSQINPIVLVYFAYRGKMQPIRNLLFYLELPFTQVHLNSGGGCQNVSQETKNILRGIKIDKPNLPLLVHNGHQVYDIMPIMNYICRAYGKEDLFGRNIKQRARVNQIIEVISIKIQNLLTELFVLAEQSVKQSKEQIAQTKRLLYQKFINESGFIKQICQYIQNQGISNTFVFQTITLVDFHFIQICHLVIGYFGDLEQNNICALRSFFKGILCKEKQTQMTQNAKHLKTMQAYLDFIYNLPFYKNNKAYLQSFTLVCRLFSPEVATGMRKIWTLNPNFVK